MIFVYPSGLSQNKYIDNIIQVWEKCGHSVVSWKSIRPFQRKSIGIISFMEDELYSSNRFFLLTLVKVLTISIVFRICTAKLIWIRHNIKPHNVDYPPKVYRLFCRWLKFISNNVVTHEIESRVYATDYIPHPLYNLNLRSSTNNRTIEYLIFGQVKRYKGIAEFLNRWPIDKQLLILGNCTDKCYRDEIYRIIDSMPNVKFDCRYIPSTELDEVLLNTKYVILPHEDNSMIVSGSFFHAVSAGTNIIMSRSGFAEKMNNRFSFVSINDFDGNLYISPHVVTQEAKKYNGESILISKWNVLFNDSE
ncbi:hypothetical protein MOS07_000586 [Vibrio vulnificus]|nr:hypothetical protein [Vibrio vulnificus]